MSSLMNLPHKGLCVLLGLLSATPVWAETKNVVLHLRSRVTMQELAASVGDPADPHYRKFYSPEEIRQLAAPTDAEYQALIETLRANGAQILAESATRLTIAVRAEQAYLETFDPSRASLARQAMNVVSPPTVVSVTGLKPSHKRSPHNRIAPLEASGFTGLTPAQIHATYGFDALYAGGLSATGQDIAIATYDGFDIGDVRDYYEMNHVSPPPTVDQVAFNGTPTFDPGSASETETDAEFSGMIAPGASIHVYASATNDDPGELQMFTQILDDNRAKVVNYSWGECETNVDESHRADMDAVFARAVAQGVNIFVATGDAGADCEKNGTTVADFPAVEPYVVAVGGTQLALDDSGAVSETAWTGSGQAGGSGGGVSTIYAPPSFQASLPNVFAGGRAYPDVAFNASPRSGQPTWLHFDPKNPTVTPDSARYVVIGGTSIAAPQWAGFTALVNAARSNGPIGYLDPILYAAAADGGQAALFHDVTSGNNGSYSAAAGWDAVTGWGSMKAEALLSFLSTH